MKHIFGRGLIRCALSFAVVVGAAMRSYGDDPVTGTVNVDTHGSFTGTSPNPKDPKLDRDLQGTHPDPNVDATYVINTTKDRKGNIILDPTMPSTVSFDDSGFITPKIPITGIKVDSSGNITSFTFKGKDWYDPNAKGANDVVSTGISGSITLNPKDPKKATGHLNASYTSLDGKTVQNISFTTTPKSTKPKQTPNGPLSSDSTVPGNKSIDYNAATGLLSIKGDTITRTPSANDPLLGASVTFPAFQYKGLTSDGSLAMFWPTGSTPYVVAQGSNVLEHSTIPFLLYDTRDNQFFASLNETSLAGVAPGSPFYDPTLPNISSPFLLSLDAVMNPSSPAFDSEANLYLAITADVNFDALTENFTASGATGATDIEYAGDPVPEPATPALLGLGLSALLAYAHRSRQLSSRTRI